MGLGKAISARLGLKGDRGADEKAGTTSTISFVSVLEKDDSLGGLGSEDSSSDKDVFQPDDDANRLAFALMARAVFIQGVNRGLMREGSATEVVSLRQRRDCYISYPSEGVQSSWTINVNSLNAEAAICVSSDVVICMIGKCLENDREVVVDPATRIQLLESLDDLPTAKKNQMAAFTRKERCLVVWALEVEVLLDDLQTLTDKMLAAIWRSRHSPSRNGSVPSTPYLSSDVSSTVFSPQTPRMMDLEKVDESLEKTANESAAEAGGSEAERPVMIYSALTTAFAISIAFLFVGVAVGTLIREWLLDGDASRFALLAAMPFNLCVAAFFLLFMVGSLWQIIGPVSQLKSNSMYYSGVRPTTRPSRLPTFTIMMPCYKESLEEVIKPTVESLKAAMVTYERQGGTVRILVCEDGMQCLDDAERKARQEFYELQDIAWVARPPHNKDGFVRKGKFKKASNMNFAMALSLRVEEILDELKLAQQAEAPQDPFAPRPRLYQRALEQGIAESQGKAWASGNIRIGEFILLIDCDTRVPSDCFLDAASEMEASPEVAILQHESGVLKVCSHFFENGIAYFTKRVNHSISFSCSNGEVGPFVGHNAFLRWSAVQEASFIDEDGTMKQWSESHVSEDFDMSLRLQLLGYITRWAAYSNGDFKEGNRWQKYAYGCSELLFNPFRRWHRGPISKLVRSYVWSNVPLHSKLSVLAYIFSYYAIASAAILTVMNWVLDGFFAGRLDQFYLSSYKVFLTVLAIFIGIGNVSGAIIAYRRQADTLSSAVIEGAKWIPFFFIFFAGMSYHLMLAILAHMFEYNMIWEGTIKTVEVSNFFREIPAILKKFWLLYIICIVLTAGMAILATDLVPAGFRIQSLTDWLPLASMVAGHFLCPILLNPWLMHFHF